MRLLGLRVLASSLLLACGSSQSSDRDGATGSPPDGGQAGADATATGGNGGTTGTGGAAGDGDGGTVTVTGGNGGGGGGGVDAGRNVPEPDAEGDAAEPDAGNTGGNAGAGGNADSGSGGDAGAVGPGILCGNETCDSGGEVCVGIQGQTDDQATCRPSDDPGCFGCLIAACDDHADCAPGEVCAFFLGESNRFRCYDGLYGSVCSTAADCPDEFPVCQALYTDESFLALLAWRPGYCVP